MPADLEQVLAEETSRVPRATVDGMVDRRELVGWMMVGCLAGCGAPPPTEDTSGPPSDTGMQTSTGSTSVGTNGVTTTGPGSSTVADSTATSTSGSFIEDPTVGSECPDLGAGRSGSLHLSIDCSITVQDCCPGDKCTTWANDGGFVWNTTRCSPLAAEPGMPGQPCTITDSAVSGLDTCDITSMCWNVDPTTLEGTCVAFCSDAGNDQYVCDAPDTRCVVSNDESIFLCLPECDPLDPACAADELCLPEPSEQGWVCVPGITAPTPAYDPCELLNVCAPGSVCVSSTTVASPECVTALGCCTTVCDPTGEPCTEPGMACVPWYEPGTAPAGLENVGVCASVRAVPPSWLGDLDDYSSDVGA